MKTLLMGALLFALSLSTGCQLVSAQAADKAAEGIEIYCNEPEGVRATIRAEVNAALPDGHDVRVTCPGDDPGDAVTAADVNLTPVAAVGSPVLRETAPDPGMEVKIFTSKPVSLMGVPT